jgi:cytochrome c oxidase subunit 2
MKRRTATRLLGLVLSLGLAGFALTGCTWRPDGFHAVSPEGRSIQRLFGLVLALSVITIVAVAVVLAYVLVRYRGRGKPFDVGERNGGHPRVQLAWTAGLAIFFAVLAVLMVRTMDAVEDPGAGSGLQVEVIGHQWWWEFRYPDLNIVTANELYVPVGQPMTIKLSAADVIHSFWVPQFGWKMDAIPGRTTTMNVTVDKTGTFQGTCTEYCGDEHAWMRIKVVAQAPTQFDAWVKAQQQPSVPPQGDLAVAGDTLFLTSTCISCHTIRGGGGNGTIGPDLTHVGSRTTLAAGVIDNTPQNLADWIRDPAAIKPGVRMPASNFTDQELQALVAYLESLK